MQPSRTVRYESIDEVLGAREHRFFGDGFRRADHRLSDLSMTFAEDGSCHLAARASVTYPADWSRKGTVDQRPHLSTVDVLIIGVRLSEILLTGIRLNADQRGLAVLRSVRIKAGRKPVEDDLADFASTARIPPQAPPDVSGRVVSTIGCTVGTLRILCEVTHPASRAGPPDGAARRAPGEPSPIPGTQQFGRYYKGRRHLLEDIEADLDRQSARATVRTLRDTGVSPPRGTLDGCLYTAASPVDCFVVGLQLGQLLLYQLDEITRADSNTLWMRDTALEMNPRRPALPAAAPALARLDQPRLLKNGKGETWRTAHIFGEFHGISLRCSVAHRLLR